MIRKGILYPIVTLLTLLICMSVPTSSLAADYSRVGVQAGDTAEYLYTYAKSGGPVSITGELFLHFVNVSGTVVRINETWYPVSGSYCETWAFDFNVSSGLVVQKHPMPTAVTPYLIAVGLDVGDPIYELRKSMTITEITLMKVTWATRWVNHYHRALSWMESTHVEDYYWDRETGLLVQTTFKWNDTWGSLRSAGTENITLIFASPFPPTTSELFLAVGAVAVVVVTIVAAFAMSKRRSAQWEACNTSTLSKEIISLAQSPFPSPGPAPQPLKITKVRAPRGAGISHPF